MAGSTGVSTAISTRGQLKQGLSFNRGGVGTDLVVLGEYCWNVILLVNLGVRSIVPYLLEELEPKNMVLLYIYDPVGQAFESETEAAFEGTGAELADKLSGPVTAQQFSGIAAKVIRLSRASRAGSELLRSAKGEAGPVLACAWRGEIRSSAGRFIDLPGDSRSRGLS